MSRAVFVAWARLSRRTKDLARELNVKLLFIPDRPPYLKAWRETKKLLESENPNVVLIQLPQGPLLWRAISLSERMGYKVVADVHTAFIYNTTVKEIILNKPFQHLLHKAELVLAHNEPLADLMAEKLKLPRDKILTIYDPLPKPPESLRRPQLDAVERDSYLVVPSSWSPDEPLDYVVEEFLESRLSGELKLVITGNPGVSLTLYRRVKKVLAKQGKEKVVLTGYLPDEEYAWLLRNARAVVAATMREYTMLSAIWEAVAYEKPFLVSETKTLRDVIGDQYPCFFKLKRGELKATLEKCLREDRMINDTFIKTINSLAHKSHTTVKKLARMLEKL